MKLLFKELEDALGELVGITLKVALWIGIVAAVILVCILGLALATIGIILSTSVIWGPALIIIYAIKHI